MKTKLALSLDFLDSFINLEKKIQKEVIKSIKKFIASPESPGLNLEKLGIEEGKTLYSIRIDKGCRGILLESDGIYHLLQVDTHDEAYDWADRKDIINKLKADIIHLFNNSRYKQIGSRSQKLFAHINAKELTALGVPLDKIQIVRSINNPDDLQTVKELFDSNVFTNLEFLAIREKVNKLLLFEREGKKELVDFLDREVLNPGLEYPDLDEDVKASLADSSRRLHKMTSVNEVIYFFNQALDSKRGKIMYTELKKYNLPTFEDIADKFEEMAGRI
jgi:hypothetical protein